MPTPYSMSYTIIKGDGVYAYYNGIAHLLVAPPPEAFNEDPNQPDVPAYAHYGEFDPHPIGHTGVGHLIPGQFQRGKGNNFAYMDEAGFAHHHGIDGVIRKVAEQLEKSGMDPSMAHLLVDEAIGLYNDRHRGSKAHQLPDVNSMEWRKIKVGRFNAFDPADERVNRNRDGELITAFTNSANYKNEKIGKFIESYSIPFYRELLEIMQRDNLMSGLDNLDRVEWLSKGYISAGSLHPAGGRFTGQGGDTVKVGRHRSGNKYHILPESAQKNAPEGMRFDAAFDPIRSWEIANQYPDLMHYKLDRQQSGNNQSIKSATGYLMAAMQANPDAIPDVQVPINTTQTSGGSQYSMMSLRDVVGKPELLKNLLTELSKTPALPAMFGRLKNQKAGQPGAGARIMAHLADVFAGEGSDYHKIMSHSPVPAGDERISVAPEYRADRASRANNAGLGFHHRAQEMWSKAVGSGVHESGASNFRMHQPDVETLRSLGVKAEGNDPKRVEARRNAVEGIAEFVATAFGHQPNRELPSEEEIPEYYRGSKNIIGYPEELHADLPEYVPFFVGAAEGIGASGQNVNQDAEKIAERDVKERREGKKAPVRVTPAAAPAAPAAPRVQITPQTPLPPQATRQASLGEFAPVQATRAPVAVAPPPLIPTGQLSPLQQQARAQIGQLDPERLRQFIEMSGIGPRVGRGETLTPREAQFQQSFGDPRQRLLTEYMKSQDKMIPEADRLMKAMENMQRDAALLESRIVKHALPRPINIADEHGIRHLAKHLSLTPLDVRSIAHQMGDWERIAKRLNVSSDLVKVVKLSVGDI
jgi:hypothetical protein